MELIVIKKLVDVLTGGIQSLVRGRKVSANDRRAGKLVSEAIAELLAINPNIYSAKAKLKKAQSISPDETESLSRALDMLETVTIAVKKAAKKKRAAKKAVAKKRAVKKAAKKKRAAKKRVGFRRMGGFRR